MIAALMVVTGQTAEPPGTTEPIDPNAQWPHWRGPIGNGVSTTARPPIRFSDTVNVRWKTAMPGRGSGSPVVYGDTVYVTSETPAASGANAGSDANSNSGARDFNLHAIDIADGKMRWTRTAVTATPHESTHSTNTFASASPCTDGKMVYAFFGSRGLHAFTIDGDPVWSKDFGSMVMRGGFGEGASPTLYGDRIVVPWDHQGRSQLFVLDKTTGDVVWQVDRDEPSNWGTPIVVHHRGIDQVIVTGENLVQSYDLATGESLWQCGGQTLRPVASPVAADGVVYVTSGFRGSFLAAIDLSARGLVTAGNGLRWSAGRDTPDLASPVLSGDKLYYTKGKTGLLTCVDPATGRPYYQTQRIQGIRTLYASPIAAGGHIYITDRSGTVVVIKDDHRFQPVAINRLGQPVDATPAAAGPSLYIRGSRDLFCISK